MRTHHSFRKAWILLSVMTVVALLGVCIGMQVLAENGVKATNSTPVTYDIEDTNPAIYVANKNANSVVGVITNVEKWNKSTRETSTQTYSEGSGVVIADGGYILTNYHVISSGDSYQILMPSGDKVDAEVVGIDSSLDLAVLKVGEDAAKELTPVAIGSVEKVYVGSTVVAIGNPGGETLFNTVTSGVISSLARTVKGGNTSRTVEYIQHDAAISSGNSGGGLFDVNGNLIGINTLKMGNSVYSNASYEGLGFAIPVDTAYPIACQIIETGKVQRLGLGVSVQAAGLYVASVVEGGPAETAGIKEGDFITAINGNRITSSEDLTDVIDQCKEGDVVTVTVARYVEDGASSDEEDTSDFTRTAYGYGYGSGYGFPFGNPFGGYYDYQQQPTYHVETLEIEVTLAYLN